MLCYVMTSKLYFIYNMCHVNNNNNNNNNNNLNIFMQDCCFSFKKKNCYQCRSCYNEGYVI